MKVALGIATLNRADLLERLFKFMGPESSLLSDILIVDNGNQDLAFLPERAEIIRHEVNVGVNRSWNQLITKAIYEKECDWVLILNDDIALAPGQLSQIIKLLASAKGKWILTPDWEWCCIAISKECADNMQYEPYKYFEEALWPGYYGDNDFHYRIKVMEQEDKYIGMVPELRPAIMDKSKTREKNPNLNGQCSSYVYVYKWAGNPGEEKYKIPWGGSKL